MLTMEFMVLYSFCCYYLTWSELLVYLGKNYINDLLIFVAVGGFMVLYYCYYLKLKLIFYVFLKLRLLIIIFFMLVHLVV